MPIRDATRHLYPADWKQLSHRIRHDRAGGACECDGRCGGHDNRCLARNREPHPITGSVVVLTVAHLDHDPTNNDEANLMAMRQRCHLRYDADLHRATRAATRAAHITAENSDSTVASAQTEAGAP